MSATGSRHKQIVDARYISEDKLVKLLKELFQDDYDCEVRSQLFCTSRKLPFDE
jgi:hypothetical protein